MRAQRARRRVAALLWLASAPWLLPVAAGSGRLRVVLDTDFGDNIDDSWALALLLGSPDVDLRLVVTASHGVQVRAQILAKFLTAAGAAPPIAIGQERKGPSDTDKVVLADWAAPSDLDTYPGVVHPDGVRAIIEEIRAGVDAGQGRTTIVSVGPRTNLAAALRLEPSIAEHAQVVSMGGSLFGGYNGSYNGYTGSGSVVAEWNIAADVAAAQQAQEAAWPIWTVPLDTAIWSQLGGESFRRLDASPSRLARALLQQSRFWLPLCPYQDSLRGPVCDADFRTCSSRLYDAVAVVHVLRASAALLDSEKLPVRINSNGTMSIAVGAPLKDWAVAWHNFEGWQALVSETIALARAPQSLLLWM